MRLRVPSIQTPTWFRDAANAINLLLGDIPEGGTTAQALVKKSDDDFDLEWATVAAASHTHAAADVTFAPAGSVAATDVQAAIVELDTEKLAASSYTAADVLAKLLTVDGAGSGLDADLLDGMSSADFAAAVHTHVIADTTGLQAALDAKLDDTQASAFGLTLLDDADAATARTTLGLGTAATTSSGDYATASHNHVTADITDFPDLHPGYVAGRWYSPVRALIAQGPAIPINTIRLLPFFLEVAITISDLGCWAATSGAGNAQLAIYASDSSTGRPTGTALAETGNIAVNATGAKSADITGADVSLQPGLYWMAVNVSVSVAFATIHTQDTHYAAMIGSATLTNVLGAANFAIMALQIAQAFGTWPDLTAAAFVEAATGGACLVYMKAA